MVLAIAVTVFFALCLIILSNRYVELNNKLSIYRDIIENQHQINKKIAEILSEQQSEITNLKYPIKVDVVNSGEVISLKEVEQKRKQKRGRPRKEVK